MLFSIQKLVAVAVSVAAAVDASYAITGVTTGVNAASHARPARRNIIDLSGDYFAFGLYIKALQQWQTTTPTSQIDGWYQVVGIHGRPYQSWDGSNGAGGVSYSTGYCEHDSVLFPTWHRPYLALFEMQIHKYAQAIAAASGGTDRQSWLSAANNLRIPYWDWASNHNIPDVVASQKITVKLPSTAFSTGSAWTTIDNPLYTYKMPKLDPNLFPTNDPNDGQLARYSFTVRQPTSTASNAASNNGLANTALSRLNLKGNIYNLLTSNIAYYQMASQANPGLSLEAVHGNVHVAVGGNNGHMTQLSYAAFDPIFWLHHANCDRLFAIWQALNPTKWIPASGEPGSWTWTNNANNRDYSGNGLTPFSLNTGGTHWSSDTSRTLAPFGYSYPELNDWSQSAAQLKTSVTAAVNKLYGPNSGAGKKMRRQAGGTDGEGATEQWYASVAVLKTALPTGFTVSVFLGTPPANSLDWQTAPNLAGALAVFPPASGLPMGGGMTMYTELSLEKALQGAGYVDTDAGQTAAYLAANLSWRVNKHDATSTIVDPASIPSLNVTVYEKAVTVPDSAYQLPSYGAPKHHPEITNGKKSGGGHGVGI